jgi:phosphatidate phosphatase APP1
MRRKAEAGMAGGRWTAAAADLIAHLDRLRRVAKKRRGKMRPAVIRPYVGFGTTERLFLRGRVIEDPRIGGVSPAASRLRNLLTMLKRYQSDEIPRAVVRARHGEHERVLETDDEGYFELSMPGLPPPVGQVDTGWRSIELELVEPRQGDETPPARALGKVLVPSADATFGVISDIDDTIVKTGATNLMRHLRTVLLNSAATRTPFIGVSAFYEALARGQCDERVNPIFYVSSSPWNLFDLFTDYLCLQDIPDGPIILREFSLEPGGWFDVGHDEHKTGAIEGLLAQYPELEWILIGDSGQRDAVIYRGIVERHPGRILAVYMRDVSSRTPHCEALKAAEDIARMGPQVVFDPHTLAAARNAAEHGWIRASALPAVEGKVAQEAAQPPILGAALGDAPR